MLPHSPRYLAPVLFKSWSLDPQSLHTLELSRNVAFALYWKHHRSSPDLLGQNLHPSHHDPSVLHKQVEAGEAMIKPMFLVAKEAVLKLTHFSALGRRTLTSRLTGEQEHCGYKLTRSLHTRAAHE